MSLGLVIYLLLCFLDPITRWISRLKITSCHRKQQLHSEELHNLYSSPNIIRQIKSRRMRWAGYVARVVEERKMNKVLVEKTEGMRPLGIPRCRSEDGIGMDLMDTGWGGLDSTGSGLVPVASCCECGDELSGSCATELVTEKSSSRQNFTVQNSPERAWTQAQRQDVLLSVTFPC
jgi:hypothetical protein